MKIFTAVMLLILTTPTFAGRFNASVSVVTSIGDEYELVECQYGIFGSQTGYIGKYVDGKGVVSTLFFGDTYCTLTI